MVIVLDREIRDEQKESIRSFLTDKGFRVREIIGEEETIFGAVGNLSIDIREVEILPGVTRVIPISKPYKLASRELKKEDTIVKVGNLRIGGPRITVIAGPCAVESRDLILETARLVRKSGAVMLRGGAFKPRTSPYSFQGLGEEGLEYMKEAGEEYGMPIISEIISPEYAAMMNEYVDVFQIGARNMQNFELLKCVGALQRPVMLKRGLAATIEEWLMAAEYLLAHGAEDVILCERGIRTFETYTRNSLDISSIPVIKKLSHLPIMVDPSHATGIREKVLPVGLAAIAAGADGLIIEVHPNPDAAFSDGPQSLYPDQFEKLMRDIEAMSPVLGKELARLPEKHETSPALRGVDTRKEKAGLTVAFQGEHGAYSEIAINRYFHSDELRSLPRPGFREVFTSVLESHAEYGLVPIENSLAGSIHENYDLLLQYPDIKIVGETMIRIVHSLIGLPEAEMQDIRRVYSHPQGLAQTGRFLQQYSQWEKVPFYDTAGSVSYIAREQRKENAAIASSEAAAYYGMKVLKEGIETNPQNYTRFFIITRIEHDEIKNPNKASIVFSTPDKPGALLKCMKVLSDRKLNMKKLESRPILGKPWEYMFYADIEIPPEGGDFSAGIEELKELSEDFKILGVYKA